ncbi:hypothetical protein [Pseudomonas koreensis]|uniref:HEAT repeat domain-containing protein n=1 Tax=Pseudomonas koreensis TaxID=198620 RepID=A0A9X3B2H0_9PSED|nr:hypothetical protein [Pseudomonas koreensis]MCU7248237.1 hypothetical protein [Pseudomonas koreensis]
MLNQTDTHVVAALSAIGLNERDHLWAQRACLVLFESQNESIVACAVNALGQLGELDRNTVLPALTRVKNRFPSLETTVARTLGEIARVA